MNRDEFIKHANHHGYTVEYTKEGAVLWLPERRDGWKASYFAECSTRTNINQSATEFWKWCKDNLTKKPLCYMDNGDIEWWGFNTEEDMVLFMLRWC